MGLSVPQYFNEYTSVAGFGPVHTHARWVRSSLKHISVFIIRQKQHADTDNSMLLVMPNVHLILLHHGLQFIDIMVL